MLPKLKDFFYKNRKSGKSNFYRKFKFVKNSDGDGEANSYDIIYQSILRMLHLIFPIRLLLLVRFSECVHTHDTYRRICSRIRNHICMSCDHSHRSSEPSICSVRIALLLHLWPKLLVGGLPQALCCLQSQLFCGRSTQRKYSQHDSSCCT